MQKIIYTPGVWDIIHTGHINVIETAKTYGDYLIVGICSDRLCHTHGKITILNESIRAKIINSLKYVDEVYIYDHPDQTNAIKQFNVNTFVVGEEFGKQGVPEHHNALEYCKQNNIPIVRIDRTEGISSTEIKEQIINNDQIIKKFWQSRAKKAQENKLGLWQSTSLTSNEEIAVKRKESDLGYILQAINKSSHNKNLLLDLGCGVGRITCELAKIYKKIHALDYIEEFVQIAKQQNKDNIDFFCADVCDFDASSSYDCCLMAGLLLHLSDDKFERMIKNINHINTIIMKESVGTFGRFELNSHYSKELQSEYNAVYRSCSEIINTMADNGYFLSYSEMAERHRKETHIQIFLFEKH